MISRLTVIGITVTALGLAPTLAAGENPWRSTVGLGQMLAPTSPQSSSAPTRIGGLTYAPMDNSIPRSTRDDVIAGQGGYPVQSGSYAPPLYRGVPYGGYPLPGNAYGAGYPYGSGYPYDAYAGTGYSGYPGTGYSGYPGGLGYYGPGLGNNYFSSPYPFGYGSGLGSPLGVLGPGTPGWTGDLGTGVPGYGGLDTGIFSWMPFGW